MSCIPSFSCVSSADHEGGGGIVSSPFEDVSSAHHDGGGGVVSNAADAELVGHHAGGKGDEAYSRVAFSADHVGGGGTVSLSAELKSTSNLMSWGKSEFGTSEICSKPGGALIGFDARSSLLHDEPLMSKSDDATNPGGASWLGTSSTSLFGDESSSSGASNCGVGHHHGAGGTSLPDSPAVTESQETGEIELYKAASNEMRAAADFIGLDALLEHTAGESSVRLVVEGLSGSSSLDSRQPSEEDPPAVDPSSADTSPSSSFATPTSPNLTLTSEQPLISGSFKLMARNSSRDARSSSRISLIGTF